MKYCSRFFLTATLVAGLMASAATSQAYDATQQKCRASIVKAGAKYAKTTLKTMVGCHKNRDKDGSLSGTDCNDIAAADTKNKIPGAVTKLVSGITKKCAGSPSAVGYEECPVPCKVSVPVISTFTDVANCLACMTDEITESMSDATNGTPASPITNKVDAGCHKAITKNGAKLHGTVIKNLGKCQAGEEKNGSESITTCTDTDFNSLVSSSTQKAQEAVLKSCGDLTVGSTELELCGAPATASVFDLSACVAEVARDDGQALAIQFLGLPGTVVTTTTSTTSTTNTTLPAGDPACPDVGELLLYSAQTNTACTNNGDCTDPHTCNTSLGICTTVADLDSGWSGEAHDSDINDQVSTRASLYCPGGAPVCGECQVLGIDPAPGNCRCNNDIRNICDEPFAANANDCPSCVGGDSPGASCSEASDCAGACSKRCSNNSGLLCGTNADCTGGGTCGNTKTCRNNTACATDAQCAGTCTGKAACDCYFGTPFPLNSNGTHVCVVNRFAEDISGTADVDAGAGAITATLRTRVYLGVVDAAPCPVCAGKCSSDTMAACFFDSECTSNNCVQDIPGDGIRDGLCVQGEQNGLSCDVNGVNASFPAEVGAPAGGGGGGYSLDCQPNTAKNISGQGLFIQLAQNTGVSSLSSGLDCDAGGVGTDLCPCMACNKDASVPCSDDSQCASLGGNCSGAPQVSCNSTPDCTNGNLGNCLTITPTIKRCQLNNSISCVTTADCQNVDVGTCALSTCTAKGAGPFPEPNGCFAHACTDLGGGEGQCTTGPDDKSCDGLVRADGTGMKACLNNADCVGYGPLYGNCTITKRRECFLDPIVATGSPDPTYPVAGAVFCVPATANGGVNEAAGLPGPGRVISQGKGTTWCATDHGTVYQPAIGGCPP